MDGYRSRESLQIGSDRGPRPSLDASRLFVFGDNVKHLPTFAIADESHVVAIAVQEVRDAATAVIASNEENGLARWLRANA